MIPSGGTGYLHVFDLVVNGLIKDIIWELEDAHYDLHEADWKVGKLTISDRRVLPAQ
jgi:hypothetical protein